MIQIFESLGLVCQTCMYHAVNILFWSWEAWHILATYEQMHTSTITKFVSSKFVAGMKRQLNRYCP
jgi:hypothetical protein